MALSAPFRFVLREFSKSGRLPRGGAILEIGEANWYEQFRPQEMHEDIDAIIEDTAERDRLKARVAEIVAKNDDWILFDLVKVFYAVHFAPTYHDAVDFQGSAIARRLDLNVPFRLDRRYDVVMNHGTAEHIFNIGLVFKTIHDHTLPGGMMIHETPFTGWIEHGFYNVQPTLLFDLALANQYIMECMVIEDLSNNAIQSVSNRDEIHQWAAAGSIPANTMLLTILRRGPEDAPFCIPHQGYYREALSEEGMAAWKDRR